MKVNPRQLFGVVSCTALATWLLLVAVSTSVSADEKTELNAVHANGGVSIAEGAAKVLHYQRDMKSLDGKYPRANYVHPLYDLDGNELTEDFPADHPHQRGIYWAWHQVWVGEEKISDPWALKNAEWEVTEVMTKEAANQVKLVATVLWKSPLWLDASCQQKPFVREETTVCIHRAAANHRAIDFEIRLLALEPGVRIGGSEDEKGYGGFSPRVRLPADVRFLSEKGPLEPQASAMDGGAWVDLTGTYGKNEATSGIAILCHPTLPVFPPPWILRRKNSMQNAVYPGAKAVLLSETKPLVLRYRLVIHRGAATAKQITSWQAEYAASAVKQIKPAADSAP